jgi:excisionase family DNA binding protein
VADRLRSSEHTIRRLIRRGDLPALRVGQQHRLDGEELERWLYGDPPPAGPGTARARRADDHLPGHRPAGCETNDEKEG